MIVHVAGSLRDPEIDTPWLQRIVEAVHDRGAIIALNWIEPALLRHKEKISVPDWTSYVEANLGAIKRSDIVIADLTHYSFAQGYVVAAALRLKKPVLAISRDSIQGHTASGITNPLFTYKKYTDEQDLKDIVNDFLVKNTIYTKDLRFNMFLTRRIFKYLEDTMRETGKSRSEIIRELVKRKVDQGRLHD